LKAENEELELVKKNRTLRRDLGDDGRRSLDIAEELGAGSLADPIKAELQSRMFGTKQPSESMLERLLTPEVIRVLLGRFLDHNNGASSPIGALRDLLGLLGDLGFDFKGQRGQPAPAGLKIGDIDLSGVVFTPEMFASVLSYQSGEKQRAADLARSDAMIEGLKSVAMAITGSPENFERIKAGVLAPLRGEVANKSVEVEDVLVCDRCGYENHLPPGLKTGDSFHCQGEGCERTWHVEADNNSKKTLPAGKVKHHVEVKQPAPILMGCPDCQQTIDVSGRDVGSIICCPNCGLEQRVSDLDTPLPAIDPLPKPEDSESHQFGYRGTPAGGHLNK
jgi:hypothetical protein